MENKRTNLNSSEKVYLQILDLIKNGEFKSGERLPTENELSKRFSSSRNTVRMALNRLRTMGIIDTIHGDGSYVRKVNSDVYLNVMIPALLYEQNDLFDILAFRRGIEVEAVILAAQNADAEDIENLNDICKRLDQVEEDPEKQWRLNTTLHMQMVRCSHSKLFVTMEEIVQSILTKEMQDFLIHQGEDIDSNYYHKMIISSIARHQPDEAGFLMSKHDKLIIDRVRDFAAE
ncbi:MAG: FadR/GntR family transcriptional regulator [Candidatus Faecousia sp.]|nr:FadR family transcriptional regulator [Clostridiales bacterium]MDY6179454.1 FadR/GntR family transcriptional regulator [Candidatus Faecousia sp.]